MELQMRDKVWTSHFFHILKEFYDFSQVAALDMFARDGALTVANYAYNVKHLDVWELSDAHTKALEAFRPRDIRIGCSYKFMAECKNKYGLIVIDNPQGVHHDGDHQRRFEHFSVLPNMGHILADQAVVVLYVNKRPYDKTEIGNMGMDDYAEYDFKKWINARQDFYDYDPQNLSEEAAMLAYRRVFHQLGFKIKTQVAIPCYSDVSGREPYAFRLAIQLEKI